MNANYNKQRGQSIFMNRIGELLNSRQADPDLLQKLASYFNDMVCVQPTAPEIKALIEAGQPHFAAGRLADACATAASARHINTENFNAVMKEALVVYANSKPFNAGHGSHVRSAADDAVDAAFNAEFAGHDATESIVVEETDVDGNMTERFIQADSFSMTQYADANDLTSEGRRAMGMLPSDFDPDNDNEFDSMINTGEQLPEAIVVLGADGYPKIHCPQCNGTEIYPDGSHNEFGCFNCDDFRFVANLRLGDLNNL